MVLSDPLENPLSGAIENALVGPDDPIPGLFANGEDGVYFVAIPKHCFQDTAAATPAASGDPVRRINDLSGNGNHLIAPSDAERPTLTTDADSVSCLQFDPVANTSLRASVSENITSGEIILACVSDTSHTGVAMIWGESAADRFQVFVQSGTFRAGFAGSVSSRFIDSTVADTTKAVVTARFTASGVAIDVNGTEQATGAAVGTVEQTTGLITLGNLGYSISAEFDGKAFAGMVINRELTSAERTAAVNTIAEHAGIAI